MNHEVYEKQEVGTMGFEAGVGLRALLAPGAETLKAAR
jgi:hypothetical protein